MTIVNDSESKLSKVLWACRRGMLELDVILQNFCEQSYDKLTMEQQQLFEALLQEEDQDLQRWLVGAEVCDKPKFQDLLLVIRHMYSMSQQAVPA
jgi:antitoxin CptB